jgi:hypothetical protein
LINAESDAMRAGPRNSLIDAAAILVGVGVATALINREMPDVIASLPIPVLATNKR